MHRAVSLLLLLLCPVLACGVDARPIGPLGGSGSAGVGVAGIGDAGSGGSGGLSGIGGSGGGTAGSGANPCPNGCDDGAFCNGVEACGPTGCLSGAPPCGATACDEASDQCSLSCGTDFDFDGAIAVTCGGNDCNDFLPTVKPGGLEVCNGTDDDCNGSIDDGFAVFGCFVPNSSFAMCAAGSCTVISCNPGFLDCDGSGSNGCETVTEPTPNDCKLTTCAGVIASPTDTPLDDGDPCTTERCNGSVPEVVPSGACGDDAGV